MERLTVYTPNGYESINPVDLCLDEYSDINFERILDKLGAYEDFEEIFREKMTNVACDFLSDKEEFGKWLDRNRWIAKKCDEWVRLLEEGRLVKLPCKIGDDVYFIPSKVNYDLNVLNDNSQSNKVYHQKVERITFHKSGWYLECDKDLEYATDHILLDKMYKETWFLKQEEAEAKLEELRGVQND